jgi:hypothetical protein
MWSVKVPIPSGRMHGSYSERWKFESICEMGINKFKSWSSGVLE